MQTSYVIRVAAWLPDSLDRLRVSLPEAEIEVWDYSQDPRTQTLVRAWGWQWQALDPLAYGQAAPGPEQILLEADEIWPAETSGIADIQAQTRIVSADQALCWQASRQFNGTLQKGPLGQREQADLGCGDCTPPRLLLALEHQLLIASEQQMQSLRVLPLPLQWRAHLRQINAHLLAQAAGQAWQALQAAFRLFPGDPVLARLLSSLLAYLGQEAAFDQTLARLEGQMATAPAPCLLSWPGTADLAAAAELALPQAMQRRAERYLPRPENFAKALEWLGSLWQDTLVWQQALSEASEGVNDGHSSAPSPLGSLRCHGLIYESARQPRLAPALAQAVFALGQTALQAGDVATAERAYGLALSNRMSGPWKLGLVFRSLLSWLQQDLGGDLVELGCHAGYSSVMIESLRQALQPQKRFQVYDAFAGLPSPTLADGQTAFQGGSMAVSQARFAQTFAQMQQTLPAICVGWFDQTLPTHLSDQIGWAYLDSDLYESIAVCLQALLPRMQAGGVLIIDDYQSQHFPGVARACQDYLPASYHLQHHFLDPFHSLAVVSVG